MITRTNLILLMPLLALTSSSMAGVTGIFYGDVVLAPKGCQTVKNCVTTTDLKFSDSNGLAWLAPKGTKTDGATFPESLEPLIEKVVGDRYDPIIMKAVVLHDHYFREPVRTWYQTNRMFYDALLESGVSKVRAKLMYSGVLVGSKIWVVVKQGRKCSPSPLGGICVYKTPLDVNITQVHEDKLPLDSEKFIENFNELALLVDSNENVSLDDLERRAAELRPKINSGLQQKILPSSGIVE